MASLVRQKIVTYRLNGKKCPASTPGAVPTRTESAKWYGQGIPGMPAGKRVPLATNKAAAQRMLDAIVLRAERGMAGMPEDGRTDLEPLIVEWGEAVGRESGPSHVREVTRNVRRVFEKCEIRALADLRQRGVAAKVEKVIHAVASGPAKLSKRTAASYGMHARQFTRWLWLKKQVLDADPLAGISLPDQSPATPRRNFTPDELGRLIAAAEKSARVYRGLTGADRAMLYLVAASTGFRVEELSCLSADSFVFGGSPGVFLPGSETKNDKDADQPLPAAVAASVEEYVRGRDGPLWPGTWTERAFQMIRIDLAAAGIEQRTARGSLVFHSLKHTYTSMLADIAPVKVVQELSRHGDPTTTLRHYVHTTESQRRAAVDAMPVPGVSGVVNPLEKLSRAELEGLVIGMAGILGVGFTHRLTLPVRDPEQSPAERRGKNADSGPQAQ